MADETLALLLAEIHTGLAKELIKRINDGSASPADLSAAIRFLKDNGVTASRTQSSPMGKLADLVPFPEENHSEYN